MENFIFFTNVKPVSHYHCLVNCWFLACTADFVHYEDYDEEINHGEDEGQDQFIFAGSLFVVNNIYYTIYNGYNNIYSKLE